MSGRKHFFHFTSSFGFTKGCSGNSARRARSCTANSEAPPGSRSSRRLRQDTALCCPRGEWQAIPTTQERQDPQGPTSTTQEAGPPSQHTEPPRREGGPSFAPPPGCPPAMASPKAGAKDASL